MYYVQILPVLLLLCMDFNMSYVNGSPNGLTVRLAASVQRPCVYIHGARKGSLRDGAQKGSLRDGAQKGS